MSDPTSALTDLDNVRLRQAVRVDGRTLPEGTIGTIMATHGEGEAYTVEFVTPFHAIVLVKTDALVKLGRASDIPLTR